MNIRGCFSGVCFFGVVDFDVDFDVDLNVDFFVDLFLLYRKVMMKMILKIHKEIHKEIRIEIHNLQTKPPNNSRRNRVRCIVFIM